MYHSPPQKKTGPTMGPVLFYSSIENDFLPLTLEQVVNQGGNVTDVHIL